MAIFKKILLGLLGLLIILQFVPVDRSTPEEVDMNQDFLQIESASQEVTTLLKSACYDCHSYQSHYPWYAYTAPTKWFIQNHIEEGRSHFNFNLWGSYKPGKKAHKAEESAEEVEEGHMPLPSYTWLHSEAKLDSEQIALLENFFKEIERKYHN